MSIFKLGALPAILLTLLGSAYACYTVTVTNSSPIAVSVYWDAGGCFGASDGFTTVCEHATIQPNSSASYDFNWGTTFPVVNVNPSNPRHYNCNITPAAYYYQGGKWETGYSADVPSCGTHYQINYTSSHLWWDTEGCYGGASRR